MSRRTRFTPDEKLAIVLAGLRGETPVSELCRRHGIQPTLYYHWRDQFLEGGRRALEGAKASAQERALEARVRELERALGKKTLELEIAGKALGMLR